MKRKAGQAALDGEEQPSTSRPRQAATANGAAPADAKVFRNKEKVLVLSTRGVPFRSAVARPLPCARRHPAPCPSCPPPPLPLRTRRRRAFRCPIHSPCLSPATRRHAHHRFRHLMNDLAALLPHCKKDSKLDTKNDRGVINEVADLKVNTSAEWRLHTHRRSTCLMRWDRPWCFRFRSASIDAR